MGILVTVIHGSQGCYENYLYSVYESHSKYNFLPVVLRVWSSHQQYWHHWECKKSKFLEPIPDLQKFGVVQQSVVKSLGDSDAGQCFVNVALQ